MNFHAKEGICERRQLRLLFITSDKYPPFRPAAKAIFKEEFAKRGHIVDWLMQREPLTKEAHPVRLGNGNQYLCPTTSAASRYHRLLKYGFDIINDLRSLWLPRTRRYDVIQVKDKYLAALLALLAGRAYSIPVFYWLAFPHPEANVHMARTGLARYRILYWLRGHFLSWLLYRVILPHVSHTFVQSEQMMLDIGNRGVSLKKMTPIPGSVNLNDIPFRPPLASGGLSQQRIIYVGTMNRMRNLDVLLGCLKELLIQHPGIELLMVGKGDRAADLVWLHERACELGVAGSVRFTGHLPMPEVWELIRSADVCLSPYFPTFILRSTSPTKLIEYMAMGKPVVGNSHPEQELVINDAQCGICCDWNEKSFAEAIHWLLQNPYAAVDMGLRGRRYVEKYRTNTVMAERVEAKYWEVLAGSGRLLTQDKES